MRKRVLIGGAVVLAGIGVVVALGIFRQAGGQQLSPPAEASCRFSDGKTITVDYSSPRVRGRKIFGGLVPYGRVWILGANQATTFDTTAGLTAGGKQIPAGEYTLFAIPAPGAWTLIVNKTSRDAIGAMSYYPGQGSDLARIPMTSSRLSSNQEDFTISFAPHGASCTMRFDWERTRASLEVTEQR